VERKTWRPTSCIPVKRSPDRFRNAFRIRFRLALPFGTDHTCSCGFSLRDENVSHPLRCNAHGSNYACHNATLAFVKSLARDAGYHAQKGDFCVRESSPSADGVRADGFIALADEDPSKTSSSMCLARIPPIFLSSGLHPTFSLRKPSRSVTRRRMPLTGASSMATMPPCSLLASPSSVPSVPISVLCSIALHKQSTTTRRTHSAALFPELGNTTLISGLSLAYPCLPPHSSKPGVFLLSLTTLMMPNAIICKMFYNHLPPPHNHLVFTLLV
jgi:hypothetical protein